MALTPPLRATEARHPLWTLISNHSGVIASVGLFSGVINLLALSSSFYMVQVYDRVLPSQSVATLIGLSALILLLFVINAALDFIRSRIMSRVGTSIDVTVGPHVFRAMQRLPLLRRSAGDGMQPVRDLDHIRSFFSGLGLAALFDLPWIPLYLFFVYMLHPTLALVAFAGAAALVLLTILTEYLSAEPMKTAARAGGHRLALAQSAWRNAETIEAMGMAPHITRRYEALNSTYLSSQLTASDAVAGIGNITKLIRMVLQSAVLGLGGYLVIKNELSAGAIIAASITVSRALAPIETAIAHWKGFVSARQAAHRLAELLSEAARSAEKCIALPAPARDVRVEQLFVAAPGEREPILKNVSFTLESGDALGIIGPSGSGKSTLARALVGIWRPNHPASCVRLDGASLDQWAPDTLGRHIGFMPQDVELFAGTVAENIARFDPKATSESVVRAAQAAGAHDMIVRLSDGYKSPVGEGGRTLSGGERQRVALARALCGDPFLVVLDEPNANLDAKGDQALAEAILSIRNRGGIAIVIAHRPSALAAVNKVLMLSNGQVRAFGARDDVLRSVLQVVPQDASQSAEAIDRIAAQPLPELMAS
jgi:ATP-binding cassette subfamily C protein PrsD